MSNSRVQGFAASNSLQRKVSLTLLTVVIALAGLSYLVLTMVVAPAFDDLDLRAAETDLIRAQRAVRADLTSLSLAANDWAPWDDAYDYVRGLNPAFEPSNLTTATMINLGLDLMLFYTTDGSLYWGRLLDSGSPDTLVRLGLFEVDPARTEQLVRHTATDSALEGLVRTALGPMLIVSLPILTTDSTGPIAGTLIMGRYLDEPLLAELRERTEVDFSWKILHSPAQITNASFSALADAEPSSIVHETTADEIMSYSVMVDLFDEPLVVLQARTPRDIAALGQRTINLALLILTLVGVILAAVTWLLLRHIIVRPLESIAGHITMMRRDGNLDRRIGARRADEIGVVAGEFDAMTAEVSKARRLLLDQSFKAGKADTAADVLHNIRNAMTPLINGIERLRTQSAATDKLRVADATAQLRDPDCDTERRDKLLQYIESGFEHLKANANDAVSDVEVVSKQARQIESILGEQEKHAYVRPVCEDLVLDEIVKESSLVLPNGGDSSVRLDIQADLGTYRVHAHRVGLLQVLGNVVLNAYESIDRGAKGDGMIRISASAESVDDRNIIRLTVSDDGTGFDEQVGRRLFQRGFSSKTGKLSGLGLHWCSNALQGMGGHIVAESDGEGCGARVHVLLPAAAGGTTW